MRRVGGMKGNASALILVCMITIRFSGLAGNTRTNAAPPPPSGDLITISYAGLVDGTVLTHSGETVSQVVRKIPRYDESLKGLVQPYLEPFSILCHDVLLTRSTADTIPFVNITSCYPVGSEQPAWVALFREGGYQLYFNAQCIRLFVPGSNPRSDFEKHRSVVRHAIQDVLDHVSGSIKTLEVYSFTNDYAKLELHLNVAPAVYALNALDLSARKKDVDLAAIAGLLEEGVSLEAVEADGENNLLFYGKKSAGQTIAGSPLSLSDIAVIYRSIFHYGNNAPYISLDRNEDNRFAKVNFGGHLENTRVGTVVLEADKLFKTISTGIEPNSHEMVLSGMTKAVPDFMTEDERALLDDQTTGHALIRYWFYPDSIGTVTDGLIGVVSSYRFLADVERMDAKVKVGMPTRKTIEHLNKHFTEYENANGTYAELSRVGRVMALVNWLKGMKIDQRIELDDFLSVPLPPCLTPSTTTKMLAVSRTVYPLDVRLTSANVRDYTHVSYLSQLLGKAGPGDSDEYLMGMAGQMNADSTGFPRLNQLKAKIASYDSLLGENEAKIKTLGDDIDRTQATFDRTNDFEIVRFNGMVDRYNKMAIAQKSDIEARNALVDELNHLRFESRQIVSIGGGIDLSPTKFRVIRRDASSPRIREVRGIQNAVTAAGKSNSSGGWVRNSAGKSATIPVRSTASIGQWVSSRPADSVPATTTRSGAQSSISTSYHPKTSGWESSVAVNGSRDVVRFTKSSNVLRVQHPGFSSEVKGRISDDGTRVEFSK